MNELNIIYCVTHLYEYSVHHAINVMDNKQECLITELVKKDSIKLWFNVGSRLLCNKKNYFRPYR